MIWVIVTIFAWVVLPQLIVKWLDKRHAKIIEKMLKDFEDK